MNYTEYLVTLNIPPSLEEMIVDSLLLLEAEHGFSSFEVNAHHHEKRAHVGIAQTKSAVLVGALGDFG